MQNNLIVGQQASRVLNLYIRDKQKQQGGKKSQICEKLAKTNENFSWILETNNLK